MAWAKLATKTLTSAGSNITTDTFTASKFNIFMFHENRTAGNTDGTKTYSSSSSGVCTVSGSTVTIVGVGDCVLSAQIASGTNYSDASGTRTISVTKADQTVTWTPTTSYTTTAQPVTWSSNASGTGAITYSVKTAGTPVCSINDSGKLIWTTNATGTCEITATAAGNDNYNPGSIDKTFTISAASLSSQFITFADPGAKVYGTNFTVSATANSGLPVSIVASGGCSGSGTSTSGSSVTITPTAGGTANCSITASQAGDSSYEAATDVIRNIDITKASQTITLDRKSTRLNSSHRT